ncbi:MAG: MotA/TolQ/ExbB proton channel family protein [Desulfovibrionaceae bacterium]
MNKQNIVGVAIAGMAFMSSFWLMGGMAAYWNLAAFVVVISGLAAALLLSYPYSDVRSAAAMAREAYASRLVTPSEIVATLLDLSVRSKVDGVLSLEQMREKTTSVFLRNGLMFLVDNYKEREIRDFMSTEMAFFSLRRQQSERIFRTMARTAPAFGVAGSVIGLIGLLMGINDTSVILSSIPVAFLSTLYGVVLGNLVLAPMAENMHFRTDAELLNQKLIMEGVVAISREQNPYKLEKKLCSFLSPEEREGHAEALRSLTRTYIKRKREQERELVEPKVAPVAKAS